MSRRIMHRRRVDVPPTAAPPATEAPRKLRGVWVIYGKGPAGETILHACKSDGTLATAPRYVLPELEDVDEATELLWEYLDRVDPVADTEEPETVSEPEQPRHLTLVS